MLKELAKWLAAGLAGLFAQVLAYVQAGGPVNLGTVGHIVLVAVLVRIAGFIIQKFGPQP